MLAEDSRAPGEPGEDQKQKVERLSELKKFELQPVGRILANSE